MGSKFTSTIGSIILEGWSRWWDGLTQQDTINVFATLLVAILAISWYWSLIKKSTTRIPPLPPGPRGLPLIGNLLSIEPEICRYFAKLSQIYGPIVKLQLGRKICIVISSPSLAKMVLKDQDAIFANRDPPAAGLAITYGGLDITFGPNGPEWRKLRKVFVREMMSTTSLDACYALRRQEVVRMVKEIYGKVGSPVNVSDQVFLTLLNVIMSMLWGASLHGEYGTTMGVQFRQIAREIIGLLGAPNISDIFPVLARFDLQSVESKMKQLSAWYDRIFESLMDNRVNEGKGSKDFLQILLEVKEQGDHKATLSLKQIKTIFMDIIVAGTVTTPITVEWAVTELLQHPEMMRKACKELEEVVGNDKLVEDFHLEKLYYLQAILKETLRLHPPAPLLIPHCPSIKCTLSGYTIPKGSTIFLNVWAIQRDPQVWKNSLEFQPDRFLKDSKMGEYRGHNFNFLPFGSGRRICAGIPISEKMVLGVLANLLHCFEWKLPDGTILDLSEKCGLVLKKSEPLIAIPTPRLSTLERYY